MHIYSAYNRDWNIQIRSFRGFMQISRHLLADQVSVTASSKQSTRPTSIYSASISCLLAAKCSYELNRPDPIRSFLLILFPQSSHLSASEAHIPNIDLHFDPNPPRPVEMSLSTSTANDNAALTLRGANMTLEECPGVILAADCRAQAHSSAKSASQRTCTSLVL